MKIVVGKSSGGNVTCSGHCQDDFDDIRFINDDNVTEYSYWMENYTSGVQATFWVNLSTNDTRMLMIYGNAGVSTTSSGNNTFIFFDDFSGTTIDTTRWEQTGLNNPSSYSESGGVLNFSATGNSFYGWNSKRDISKPFIVESRVKYYTVNTYCGWAGTVWSDTTHWVAWIANGADTVSAATKDGTLTYDASTYGFGNNVWSRTSVYWKAGQAYYQRNFTTTEALSTNVLSTASASVGLVLNTGSSGPAHGICYDFTFARKYVSGTKPTWSSFSAEASYVYTPPVFPITVSGVYPAPGAIDIETSPELAINVTHLEGANVNITWYYVDTTGPTVYLLASYYGYDGEECNHTFYTTFHRYDFNPWQLGHKYSWYVNITDGDGHSRNFPNESADGDAYSTWYLYNFTTGSVNNTDDIVFVNNTVNTSGGYEYTYINGSGGSPGEWKTWMNFTGNGTGSSGSVVLNVNGRSYTWYFPVGAFGGLGVGMVLWRRRRKRRDS
jgi:hypothetical protein